MTAAVPRQFTGAARALTAKLGAEAAVVNVGIGLILAPLRRRAGRHPVMRQPTLMTALKRWQALPSWGRVSFGLDGDGLRDFTIREIRITTGSLRFVAWDGDTTEAGVVIVVTEASLRGRDIALRTAPIAAVSLHGLARRWERGHDRSEAAVMRDLVDLAQRARTVVRGPATFVVPVTDGQWAGTVAWAGDRSIACARTFYDSDARERVAA